mmetsp:Transcript_4999/g.5718  ORF Transcript_4999/g.5718 Transcript_4999/m.5718 type:complete len:226 (-) Transcript_4999:341-1018(-)
MIQEKPCNVLGLSEGEVEVAGMRMMATKTFGSLEERRINMLKSNFSFNDANEKLLNYYAAHHLSLAHAQVRSRGDSANSQNSSDSDFSSDIDGGINSSFSDTDVVCISNPLKNSKSRSRSCLSMLFEEENQIHMENSNQSRGNVENAIKNEEAKVKTKATNQKSPIRRRSTNQIIPNHVEFKNCRHCNLLFPSAHCGVETWRIRFCSGECYLTYMSSAYKSEKRR